MLKNFQEVTRLIAAVYYPYSSFIHNNPDDVLDLSIELNKALGFSKYGCWLDEFNLIVSDYGLSLSFFVENKSLKEYKYTEQDFIEEFLDNLNNILDTNFKVAGLDKGKTYGYAVNPNSFTDTTKFTLDLVFEDE